MKSSILFGREEVLARKRMCISPQDWRKIVPCFMPEPPGKEIVFLRKLGGIGDVMRIGAVAKEYKKRHPDVDIVMGMPDGLIGCVGGKGGMNSDELFYKQTFFSKLMPYSRAAKIYDQESIVNLDNWMTVGFEQQLMWMKGECPDRSELFAHYVNMHVEDGDYSWLKPNLVLKREDKKWASTLNVDGTIAIAIKSAGLHRSYPLMRCIGCKLQALGYRTIFIDDRQLTSDFMRACAILQRCKALITPDTVWIHAANALNVPSFILFSSSIPSTVILSNPLAVPMHGGCPIDDFPCCLKPTCVSSEHWNTTDVLCFEQLAVEDVVECVLKFLGGLV